MEGCEKWKRRGTYRRHGLRQELFRALWKTRLRKGFPSEIVASQVPPRVAGVAVSDDREGEKSRAWAPTSRAKAKKEGKTYSQGPNVGGLPSPGGLLGAPSVASRAMPGWLRACRSQKNARPVR